jgi:RNA polymerase sigma-70 factor (ECF subfamily)
LQTGQGDTQLVQASQHGDQDAFALLVQRYQRRVFNLALGMLQDYADASESTQEAFLAAWQELPGFRSEARFPTWLYRITYHRCLRQLERHKLEQALQVTVQAERGREEVNTEKQAEGSIERHDLQTLVREQLGHLPTKYRTVLILRHLQDMTYEEMAEILTLPVGAVKIHLFRAGQILKERLLTLQLVDPASGEQP